MRIYPDVTSESPEEFENNLQRATSKATSSRRPTKPLKELGRILKELKQRGESSKKNEKIEKNIKK